jgi:hypothetical protein
MHITLCTAILWWNSYPTDGKAPVQEKIKEKNVFQEKTHIIFFFLGYLILTPWDLWGLWATSQLCECRQLVEHRILILANKLCSLEIWLETFPNFERGQFCLCYIFLSQFLMYKCVCCLDCPGVDFNIFTIASLIASPIKCLIHIYFLSLGETWFYLFKGN